MGEVLFPNWDPVIFSLGALQIRWYSLSYILAFVVGHMVLTRLARARLFPLPPEKVPDLVFWLVLGVMLGGRIGYCFIYKQELLLTWRVVAVWEGGLSFHGGLLGVVIAAVLFARRHAVSPWRTLDCLAIATPPGVLFVRCANFINGELYGRVCDPDAPLDPSRAPAWAMRFPNDPVAQRLLGGGGGIRDREALMRQALEVGPDGQSRWDLVRDQVPLRHPSQIYEALGEGLLLVLVLGVVYMCTRHRPLGSGVYGGIFALGYGAVRFVIEYFREPDAQFKDDKDAVGTVFLGMTMGQLLCTAMIAYGIGVILWGWRRREGLRPDDPEQPEEPAARAALEC